MRCSSVLILLCALAVAGGTAAQPEPGGASSATPEQAATSAPPADAADPAGAAEADPDASVAQDGEVDPAIESDAAEDQTLDAVPPGAGPSPQFASDEEGTIGSSTAADEPVIEMTPAPSPAEAAQTVPSPAEMSERLSEGLSSFDGADEWTAPVPVFALDGYMRMRGELMDTFWLGRPTHESAAADANLKSGALGPDPFSRFQPLERRQSVTCVDEDRLSSGTGCDVDTLQFANMRLRLSPQLNLTEDVRIHATFDILDNVVAGERPQSFYGTAAGKNDYSAAFADSVRPGGGWLSDSIVARRAWAEVRNRDLGELRFGRMADHWGLGMRYNAGNGLDQDFSSDVDRVMAVTKLAGFYFTAAYDFLAEGGVAQDIFGSFADRPYFDGSQLDDLDQFTFSISRQLSTEEEQELLARGEPVLNGGLRFELRNQDSLYLPSGSAAATAEGDSTGADLQALNLVRYVPDAWVQFKLPGIRLEAEVAWAFGSVSDPDEETRERTINQLGIALESEFRFLEDKLALYFNGGFATGDEDVEGLSADADFVAQESGDDRITTYSFHPSYQVDMILWRNLMRQVSGAYYFKPGVSYDFVRTDFGELFGARLDVIWSRASSFLQSPGNEADLGVELNAQIYWRSEDGAEMDDGYHASLQYGVLFPLAGLGFPEYAELVQPNLEPAQQLRLVLGVVF